MKGLRIVSMGSALPQKIVTNDDLSKIVDTSDEWISSRTGIKMRRLSSEEDKNYLFASQAASQAIERAGISKDDIAFVIVATVSPDYMFPSTACMVQKQLGLSEDVMSFDISAACSGFLYGLKVAKGLLENMDRKYAIVIGSEQLSRLLDFSDRATCVLFGDGAGAAVVTLSDTNQYCQKVWSRGDDEVLSCKGPGNNDAYLQMDGRGVFKFAVTVVKDAIDAILDEKGITLDDIDYVVCHQANQRIIDHVRKKYDAPEEKFYVNLQNYGNTSAASIPIVLDEMMSAGLLDKGKKIIAVGFGAGLTWSSALLEF